MLSPPRHIARLFEAIGRATWRHKWKVTLTCTIFLGMWLTWEATAWECGGGKNEARIEVGQLTQMVESYYLTTDPHRFPFYLDQLVEEGIVPNDRIPVDPWGRKYAYVRVDARNFFIASAGPDGQFATEDDIASVDDWELCQHRATKRACR